MATESSELVSATLNDMWMDLQSGATEKEMARVRGAIEFAWRTDSSLPNRKNFGIAASSHARIQITLAVASGALTVAWFIGTRRMHMLKHLNNGRIRVTQVLGDGGEYHMASFTVEELREFLPSMGLVLITRDDAELFAKGAAKLWTELSHMSGVGRAQEEAAKSLALAMIKSANLRMPVEGDAHANP